MGILPKEIIGGEVTKVTIFPSDFAVNAGTAVDVNVYDASYIPESGVDSWIGKRVSATATGTSTVTFIALVPIAKFQTPASAGSVSAHGVDKPMLEWVHKEATGTAVLGGRVLAGTGSAFSTVTQGSTSKATVTLNWDDLTATQISEVQHADAKFLEVTLTMAMTTSGDVGYVGPLTVTWFDHHLM